MFPLFAALLAAPAFAEEAAPAAPPGLVGIAEVWGGFTLRTDSAGATPTLNLRRLAAGAEWSHASGFRAKLLLDGAQAAGMAEPQIVVRDAWAGTRSAGGTGVFGRVGAARASFGVMDRFEEGRRFWVAGDSAELERVAGWQPESAVAATVGGFGKRWSATAELGDAAPLTSTGLNFSAVEARGRGELHLGGEDLAVHTGASVAYRLPGLDETDTRLLGEAHVELVSPRLSALISGVGGTEGADGMPLAGAMVTLAAPIPVGGEVVREVGFVVGGIAYDPTLTGLPDAEDIPDAELRARAGVNLTWKVGARSLVTGLGFSAVSPQDIALPVTETLNLEAAWRF
ncbi:hypothetical protein LBMAG42_44880 [Deltaproteobacteria bacterium]|nr:hypothetical protein LBMAG42_44880 [Deltaproteobacteria bacterium]